jgi:hypothetical protein
MLDWGYCQFIIWHATRDRVREVEKNQLARRARTGHRRRFHPLSWARAWSERRPPASRVARQGHARRVVEKAAKVPSSGGDLIP